MVIGRRYAGMSLRRIGEAIGELSLSGAQRCGTAHHQAPGQGSVAPKEAQTRAALLESLDATPDTRCGRDVRNEREECRRFDRGDFRGEGCA